MPLLVVDVQQGFVNDYTHHIPQRVATLIARGQHRPVLFTRFVNTPDSTYRRLLDWHDCASDDETALAAEVAPSARGAQVFRKEGIAGLPSDLKQHLREAGYRQVAVCGIDTDMCVLKSALDLFDMGIEPVVWIDCCASTAGIQAHLAGLAILGRNVGPRQLRLTGLFEGYLAAP